MTKSTIDPAPLLNALEAAPIQEITPGLRIRWLLDRRILVVIADSSTRPAIDAWAQFMFSAIRNWPDDRTYLAVQDLSSPRFSLTPYARKRASETYEVRPSLKGRVAIILPRTFIAQIVRLFIRGEKRNHFETRFFANDREALIWLAEELPEAAGRGAASQAIR
jgi:hypothetical protein